MSQEKLSEYKLNCSIKRRILPIYCLTFSENSSIASLNVHAAPCAIIKRTLSSKVLNSKSGFSNKSIYGQVPGTYLKLGG